MRCSVFGAGLFFCGVFAVAGGLAACASGTDTGNQGTGEPNNNISNQQGGNDASVDDTGSGDDVPTTSYGDAGTATGDEPAPTGDDSGLDGGEEAAPPIVGPTCTAGQNCVDIAPAGWTGYVQLVLQNGDAGAPCAAPYEMPQPQLTGETDVDGGPATCAPCTCGVPDAGPITCAIDLGGGACTGGMPLTVAQGACVKNPFLFAANGSAEAPVITSPTVSCGPAHGGQQSAPPPPITATLATVCASAAGTGDAGVPNDEAGASDAGATMTCTMTQACAAIPQTLQADGGSPSGPCIYQSGVQACPTGVAFTAQYVVGPVSDNRGCSCSCGDICPADGYVQGYTSSDCSGSPVTSIAANTACAGSGNTHGSTTFKYFPTQGTWTGACSPNDAGPSGSVSIDGGAATTFCCMP